ncbi:MAG TPA: hypothetical protein VLT36_19810 [Candidatus Dormibacteraeota bacterium]|nr:hypothetical protein [Candidatus Dormibacteraeota bacterium]
MPTTLKKLLVVTDLGHFKAFEMEEDPTSRQPKLNPCGGGGNGHP